MHSSDDKKKKFFAWMRVVLFMLCLIAVCSILKFAIMPPSYARVIIHTMNGATRWQLKRLSTYASRLYKNN